MNQLLSFADQKQTQALLDSIHFFERQGFCPATSTNHSIRLSRPDQFLITRSGVDKSLFTVEDLLVINGDGQIIDHAPGLRPSAETELHTMIYRRFPDTKCVMHTHSLLGTWLSQKFYAQKALRLGPWEILKGLEGNTTHEGVEILPIVKNSQHMPDIIREMEEHWPNRPRGFLIAGHGLYTWGTDVAQAKRHIETFEFLFKLLQLGPV